MPEGGAACVRHILHYGARVLPWVAGSAHHRCVHAGGGQPVLICFLWGWELHAAPWAHAFHAS